jgi:hypothetical protein
MPKQILKIDQFHGGLSSNSDPRDIAPNELPLATDIMVDELGKIRTLGGTSDHDATPSTAIEIEPGYGLFQFSHDRINGHLGEHLAEGNFATHVNWDDNTDWDDGVANTTTYTHSSGNGYIEQIAADRLEAGIPSITYAFTCTITGLDSDSEITNLTSLYIKGGSGYFAASDTNITKANGTHRITFTSHSSANTGKFRLYAASSGTTVWSMDNVSLVIAEAAETGDDYLLLGDNETDDPAVYIYSKNEDTWNGSQTITLGTTTGMKPAFYAVDGAVRISDGSFGATNTNQWYGYIKRTLFPDALAVEIDQWYSTAQKVSPPGTCYFEAEVNMTAAESSITSDTTTGSTTADDVSEDRDDLNTALTGASITSAVVSWIYRVTGGTKPVSLELTVGTYYDGSFVTSQVVTVASGTIEPGVYEGIETLYFDPATTILADSGGGWGGGTSGNLDFFRAEFTANVGTYLDTWGIESMVLSDAGTVGLTDYSAILGANNTVLEFDWELNTGASGWQNAPDTGKWEIGVSFIYDGSQESQLTVCVDDDATSTTSLSPPAGATMAPVIRMYIEGFISNGWNKRITGCNVYMRDISQDSPSPWFLQLSGDFETGKMIVGSTQQEFDLLYNSTRVVYYWEISNAGGTDIDANEAAMLVPADIVSYEDNSGLNPDEKSIISKYKTAVVANRIAYIGNIEVQYENTTEVMGDAMIKSPVNKFDLFPLARRIEISARDGDEIVRLEEYADRILQFKKNKMQLLNISQEIEILEDTFMHKGVSHPAAICRTDFGIAWVNKLGCYLYDGKNVINLLEKQGRQIVKESEWAKFLTADKDGTSTELTPMVGYLPKKRQIVVFDDITTGGNGSPSMYLYDMVTQSWVQGANDSSTRIIDILKTNFITDWNGDLVYAHTTGTILKWDDTSDITDTISFKTKDIDFGQPAQRKKIYKAYVSYKGDGTRILINYTTNGDNDTYSGQFYRCNADGSTTGATASNEPLYQASVGTDDWINAELKPTTSINNIYSFQLKFDGATVDANFEINDISIVYRLKGVK